MDSLIQDFDEAAAKEAAEAAARSDEHAREFLKSMPKAAVPEVSTPEVLTPAQKEVGAEEKLREKRDEALTKVRASMSKTEYLEGAFEAARVSVFKDTDKGISKEDPVHFMTTYFERGTRGVSESVQNDIRLVGSEVGNEIRDASAAIDDAGKALDIKIGNLIQSQFDNAKRVAGALQKVRTDVVEQIAGVVQTTVDGLQDSIDAVRDEALKKYEERLQEDIRVAVRTSIETEVTLLKAAVKSSIDAMNRIAATANQRAAHGALRGVIDDINDLFDEKNYPALGVLGVVAGIVLIGFVKLIF